MKFNKNHKELAVIGNEIIKTAHGEINIGGSGYGYFYSTTNNRMTLFFCAYNFEVYYEEGHQVPSDITDRIQSYYRKIRRR